MDQLTAPMDYLFEGYRLDTSQQILVPPAGNPIPLASKVFQTLLYLVEHAGEPVEKRTLLQVVWPNVVVEENNLNQCVVAIRKALGESAGDRRFILTLPGHGFKFIAPVRALRIERGACEAPTQDADPATEGSTGRMRLLPTALAAGLVAIISIDAWLWWRQPSLVTQPSEYVQLTDEDESAAAPALSPDGRMLAFIRGGRQYLSPGQIYVKLLPSGEPVRLTNIAGLIYAPAFSPDGARVSFTFLTVMDPQKYDTLTVPVIGGEPARLLPNASGLSWIGPTRLMYSEAKSGAHMGIVTSTESRAEHREIYLPEHERGMANFSYLSPDQRSVLIVEKDRAGLFQRCRLVPFDGSSKGAAVGPPGSCLSAAWSPDGKWMYFSVAVGGHSHLWRQRFPDGEPQQITFGPTDEVAVVASPDGHSLITSLGTDHSSIWLHDAVGERRLTEESHASTPWLSGDGWRLYYLRAPSSTDPSELYRLDLNSNRTEALLPGSTVLEYDVSSDEREIAFTTEREGERQVWIAVTDRRTPPRLLVRGADEPIWGGPGRLFYRQIGAHVNFLYRTNSQGTQSELALQKPILNLFSASPDGRWVTVYTTNDGHADTEITRIADQAVKWAHPGYWPTRWSRDGKLFYLSTATITDHGPHLDTWVAPSSADGLPADLSPSAANAVRIPALVHLFSPSSSLSTYAFVKEELHRNIYRIPVH